MKRALLVLVAVCAVSCPAASAASFVPAATPAFARSSPTATRLQNGKVLVVGGLVTTAATSAELYDPAANTWTAAAPMTTARFSHTATLLPNGKVLVVGGSNGTATILTAELYNPIANTWSSAGTLSIGRFRHTATLLPNGKVLIWGGDSNPAFGAPVGNYEIYDPSINTWSAPVA